MSKYTIRLRYIKDEFYNAMQDYLIFDESYRQELNDKIYHACRNREIGFETVEMFLEELQEWMELNMQEYNYLYKSILLDLNPLQRAKIIETLNSTEDSFRDRNQDLKQTSTLDRKELGSSETNVDESSNSTRTDNLNSETKETGTVGVVNKETDDTTSTQYNMDFPQGNLSDATDSNYYSSGTKSTGKEETTGDTTTTNDLTTNKSDTGTVSNSGNAESSSNTEYDNTRNDSGTATTQDAETTDFQRNYEHQKEKTGNTDKTDFELLRQYRNVFLNVDKQLITAMKKELFMNIW